MRRRSGDSFFDENGELMPMWSDLKEEGIEDSTAVLTVDEDGSNNINTFVFTDCVV